MAYDVIDLIEKLSACPEAQAEFCKISRPPIRCPEDLPSDWRIEWEERAAIMEYDGGLVREHAEAEALRDIVSRMNLKPVDSAGGPSDGIGEIHRDKGNRE